MYGGRIWYKMIGNVSKGWSCWDWQLKIGVNVAIEGKMELRIFRNSYIPSYLAHCEIKDRECNFSCEILQFTKKINTKIIQSKGYFLRTISVIDNYN